MDYAQKYENEINSALASFQQFDSTLIDVESSKTQLLDAIANKAAGYEVL